MNSILLAPGLYLALGRSFAVVLFAALLLSTSGAFDTEAAPFVPRLAYWLFNAALCIVALETVQRLLAARLGERTSPGRLRAAGWLLTVLPLNAVAALTCKLLFGGWPSIGGFVHLLPGMASILAALQLVLMSFAPKVQSPPMPERQAAPREANSALADLLPLPLRAERIDAIQAEDHYVRVHTPAGQALIRMRFADAVATLAHVDGFQPHRSWWVATAAVKAMKRSGERTMLTLASGQQVPVSRRARSLLGPHFTAADLGAARPGGSPLAG